MIAWLAACRPPDDGSSDRYVTPTIEDSDTWRAHSGAHSGAWDEHCPRDPCVAQVPHRLFAAPRASGQYVGYDIAATRDHVLVGAPFVSGVEPKSREVGRVYRLDRFLEPRAEWLGEASAIDDGAGLEVDIGSGGGVAAIGQGDLENDDGGGQARLVEIDSGSLELGSVSPAFVADGRAIVAGAELLEDGVLLVSVVERDARRGRVLAFDPPHVGQIRERDAESRISSRFGVNFAAWDADHDGDIDLVVGLDELSWFPLGGNHHTDDASGWTEACSPACDFGQFTTSVPDIDGDGFSDLAVGAPQRDSVKGIATGRLYFVPGDGPPGDIGNVASVVVEGDEEGQAIGFSAAAGDLDGDGVTDLVVGGSGVWGARTPGEVLLFRGPVAPGVHFASDADLRLFGERPRDLFGRSVAILLASDGGPDGLLVGAPGADGGSGAVYLVEGDDLPW